MYGVNFWYYVLLIQEWCFIIFQVFPTFSDFCVCLVSLRNEQALPKLKHISDKNMTKNWAQMDKKWGRLKMNYEDKKNEHTWKNQKEYNNYLITFVNTWTIFHNISSFSYIFRFVCMFSIPKKRTCITKSWNILVIKTWPKIEHKWTTKWGQLKMNYEDKKMNIHGKIKIIIMISI